MKRNTIGKTFTLAAVTALALAVAPGVIAADFGCTNVSIQGTFAFNGVGSIVSPANQAGPLALVNTLTFDEYGNITAGTGSTSIAGNISPITETGTYTVNPDCTGTFTVLISPLGFTAHYFFVIDNSQTQLEVVCTDAGVVFSGVARRQF
jgi:hypothetical protein